MGRVCLAFSLFGLRVFGFFTDPWLSDRDIHAVIGEPNRVERKAANTKDLNVVRWNIERGTETTAVLIAGDFNNGPLVQARGLSSLTEARFADALGDDAGKRGPTSIGDQHYPIDWIFVRNMAPLHGHVIDARSASDHSPVMAALSATAAVAAGSR